MFRNNLYKYHTEEKVLETDKKCLNNSLWPVDISNRDANANVTARQAQVNTCLNNLNANANAKVSANARNGQFHLVKCNLTK